MITRIYRSFINEIYKSFSSWFLILGLALSIALPFLCRMGFERIGADESMNAYGFVANCSQSSVTSIIPIFALIFSCLAVASETDEGTCRDALSRPLRRFEFLASKILVCGFYLCLLLGANLAASMILAQWKFGFSAVSDAGETLVSLNNMFLALGKTTLLGIFTLSALIAFGLFISIVSKSVMSAVGFGLGIYISLQTVKFMIPVGSHTLDYYIFSTYFDEPYGILNELSLGITTSFASPDLIRGLWLSAAAILFFLLAGFLVFLRRDLNI